MKKFAGILVTIYLAAHLSACTSSESREDETVAPTEETASVDSELEKVEGADVAGGDEANAGFVDEQLPEQALGEAAPSTDSELAASDDMMAPTTDSVAPEVGAVDSAGSDTLAEVPPMEEPAPVPAPDTSMASNDMPMEPTPSAGIDPGTSTMASNDVPVDAAPKPKASLKKIKDAPFHEGKQLLNGVYIARKGDSYGSIAEKIYGDKKKQKDLKKANPYISSVKAGDKVYYNSPMRPQDDATMKTYYEENGGMQEVYVAQEGDDLKKVAKKLLGSEGAWKEIYVTNKELDSKDALIAGTEIRYYRDVPAGNTMIAKNETAPPSNNGMNDMGAGMGGMGNEMPPPPDMGGAPPAPDMMANNPPPMDQLPPPPDMNNMNGGAAGTMAEMPPPPPPPPEMAPPPPPPPMEAAPPPPPPIAQAPKAPKGLTEEALSNDDMMMGLAAVGILAAGIAGLMVIRKRRQQKEMAAAFGDTQIGAS